MIKRKELKWEVRRRKERKENNIERKNVET